MRNTLRRHMEVEYVWGKNEHSGEWGWFVHSLWRTQFPIFYTTEAEAKAGIEQYHVWLEDRYGKKNRA